MNSNKKRGLNDSEYNERRSECEKALEYLKKVKEIEYLGDLTVEEFEKIKDVIKEDKDGETLIKRARHAVYENARTIEAMLSLTNEDATEHLKHFGELMNASHFSLKEDYEVTGIELDTLVELARRCEGVLGARMTGAGFGGCAISLVHNDYVEDFIKKVGRGYEDKIGYKADFYVVETGDGACEI